MFDMNWSASLNVSMFHAPTEGQAMSSVRLASGAVQDGLLGRARLRASARVSPSPRLAGDRAMTHDPLTRVDPFLAWDLAVAIPQVALAVVRVAGPGGRRAALIAGRSLDEPSCHGCMS